MTEVQKVELELLYEVEGIEICLDAVSGIVSITDRAGKNYSILEQKVCKPVCEEAEFKFCYHEENRFIQHLDVNVTVTLICTKNGEKRQIAVDGCHLSQKIWSKKTAIVQSPIFLKGAICIQDTHRQGTWILLRFIQERQLQKLWLPDSPYPLEQRKIAFEQDFINNAVSQLTIPSVMLGE